jgi:hypothetical protein
MFILTNFQNTQGSESRVGTLFIILGLFCIGLFLFALTKELKKAQSVKEKWTRFFDVLFDEFIGISGPFYVGVLLVLYGLLRNLHILD